MPDNVQPAPVVEVTVMADDLASGRNLVHLIVAVARRLGHRVDWADENISILQAREAADRLLAALGIVKLTPPPLPEGVEGLQINGRQ